MAACRPSAFNRRRRRPNDRRKSWESWPSWRAMVEGTGSRSMEGRTAKTAKQSAEKLGKLAILGRRPARVGIPFLAVAYYLTPPINPPAGTMMRALAKLSVLFILSVLAASAADGAPPLAGELGTTQQLDFTGQRQFSPDDLKRALNDDLEFLLAADPTTPLDEFLSVLKSRLLAGYQRAGFADASVEAVVDAPRRRIAVSISEARRYVAGPIRVVGRSSVPEAAVARWLTSSHPAPAAEQRTGWEMADGLRISDAFGEEPIWQPGKPAHFNAWSQDHLTKQVCLAFAEHGYFFPQLEVKVLPLPRSGQAELAIEVFDDGPPGVVGEIEMLSTGKNSRESILKLIEFSPGMPLTHARLMQIKKRLYDSARFARFDVRPQPPAESDGPIRLKLELVEAQSSPLLA